MRLEDFCKLMKKLSKDCDIITTAEFLDLYARGRIKTAQTIELKLVEMKAPAGKETR